MSLINDALKRAKQAQQENPPATPPLEFRPVETGQRGNHRTTLLAVGLTLVIVAILGLSGLLVWYVQQSKQTAMPVAARIADPPLVPLAATTNPPATPLLPLAPDNTLSNLIAPRPDNPEVPNTNRYPVAGETALAPPPLALKLQGIFFNPQNPSAVVSGKTVYLGDRVNGFRVMGISPVAVTLVNAMETNVLSLSE